MDTTTTTAANEEVSETPEPIFDAYEASLKFEEECVKKREESEDQELFIITCEHIRHLMKEILQLKTEKPENWSSEIESRKVNGLLLMMSLRRLSRLQRLRVKDAREKSSDCRQDVDGITLHLHNLLYEVSHLKDEVRKCLEFKSADTKVELISVDQFYLEAPENISRPEKTRNDEHQQRLAQLHWELEQRRGQTELTDKLNHEKESISNLIAEQEAKLNSLLPRINNILEATLPLQEALDLPLEANKQQQESAQFLPAPLYTLWVQLSSYGEACDSSLRAVIKGDVEAAKKLTTPEVETAADDSDSDGDVDAHEENGQRKGRGRKERPHVEIDDSGNQKLKELLTLHPLNIELSVSNKDRDGVVINFFYAQNLRVVTVKCSLKLRSESSLVLTNILNGEDLLDYLFPKDSGMESPNFSNLYQLKKLKIDAFTGDHLKQIGKPYKWAQCLAGLSFMLCEDKDSQNADKLETTSNSNDEEEDEDADESKEPVQSENCAAEIRPIQCTETLSWRLSVEHMHKTVSAIRRRLTARLSLQNQLVALEGVHSTSGIPVPMETLGQLFPGKVSSNLSSFRPIAWSDYKNSRATQHLTDSGVVAQEWFTFKAVYQRESVTLEAYIGVSPDYPNVTPVFGLLLFWNKDYTSVSNPHVCQMEAEVNSYCGELVLNPSDRFFLLSLQLYRLAMCLDILTEAGSVKLEASKTSQTRTEFHKEKIFFRPNRGPDRALPYKYLPKLGVFAQR